MALRDEFRLVHPIRVRWGECDAQGIVFNVNYFLYFDVAMTEWLRAIGLSGAQQPEFYTVHAEADFKASAKFDDMVEACARCTRLGRTSMTIEAALFRADTLLTAGRLVYVHARPGTQEKKPLPEDFIASVTAFEITPPERA